MPRITFNAAKPENTDFDDFLHQQVDGSDTPWEPVEDLDNLLNGFDGNDFTIDELPNGGCLIRGNRAPNLLLATQRARDAFHWLLRGRYAHGFGYSIEAWAAYSRAVNNPNS